MTTTHSRNAFAASLLATLACAIPTEAHAQVFGADTSVTQSDRFNSGGYGNGPGGVFNGGEGDFASFAELTGNELDANGTGPWQRGHSRASAFLSGANVNPLAPALRAEARLTGNFSTHSIGGSTPVTGASFTQAGALETYQYTGTVPITLTLTYNLHGDYFNNGGQAGLSGIFLIVGVLSNVGFYSTSLDTLIFEGGATVLTSGGNEARGVSFIQSSTNGFVTQTIALPFDVIPGQIFSVVGLLQANAVGGTSYADAYSTATGTFDRPDLITSLSAPAPSAVGVLAIGSVALLRRRR